MDNERTIQFVIEGERVEVTREYGVTDREQVSVDLERIPAGATTVSFTGETAGNSGQCQDAIKKLAKDLAGEGDHWAGDVVALCNMWDRWHLNNMKAGTARQNKALDQQGSSGYEADLATLEELGLKSDNGYVYGRWWLIEPIPQYVINHIENLLDDLDGRWIGEEPDVDDAPDLEGSIIDSRDVIKAFEIYQRAVERAGFDPDKVKLDDAEGSEFRDIVSEFLHIRELVSEAEGADDWEYGETLIADNYFKEYAKELADDIGAIDENLSWPNSYIDWDAAADALKMDYTSVEFKGKTYLIRA